MKINKKSFQGKSRGISVSLVALIFACCFLVTATLAYMYDDIFSTGTITMSGKVDIEAVGVGEQYKSIEDTASSSNLVIELDDIYKVLIPGMPIDIIANCKVSQSTTTPLLRAKVEMELSLMENDETPTDDAVDDEGLLEDIILQFDDIITKHKDWYQYSDGFYYYVGDLATDEQLAIEGNGDILLKEVNALTTDAYVAFIDEAITFPTYITSNYSGFGVTITITFQAIQNFIPNSVGNRLPSTIANSQHVFADAPPIVTE